MAQVNSMSQGPVTFHPAHHAPEAFEENEGFKVAAGKDPSLALLRAVASKQGEICAELLHSSFPTDSKAVEDIIPRRHGFVHTVIEAYNRHRALIIRPDDVWLAILTQFCFFVNGNAEALRSTFVAHEGKQEFVIEAEGNRYSMDPAHLATQMTELMERHIVDESLRSWIMPSFTTTTPIDSSTSAIVMMGTMKEYSSFKFRLRCGIPKVMLEGTKTDWEDILYRLERLKGHGTQTTAWYHLLRPILSRFAAAYDNPASPENLDFWSRVVHFSGGGSGPTWLSGWITAFCVFTEKGKWQGDAFVGNDSDFHFGKPTPCLTLDGTLYPRIDDEDVPCGYVEVDIKLDDNGQLFDTMFVAGSIGSQMSSSSGNSGAKDTIRPMPGWWYFIKGEPSESLEDHDYEQPRRRKHLHNVGTWQASSNSTSTPSSPDSDVHMAGQSHIDWE